MMSSPCSTNSSPPASAEDDALALANALALTEAQPWWPRAGSGSSRHRTRSGARSSSSLDEAIPVLSNVVVAPVMSTVRLIPTCVPLGADEGIDHDSVASFDNVATAPEALLTTRLGELGPAGREHLCPLRGAAGPG
jgi:mRNA interferase MazF